MSMVSRTGCHSLVKRTIRILRSIEAVFVGKKILISIIHFWAEFKFDFLKQTQNVLRTSAVGDQSIVETRVCTFLV